MDLHLSHRTILKNEYEFICQLPHNAEELYYMFPKAAYPLTVDQLETAINNRHDNTVILSDNTILAFANFYEVKENDYCSIGNVIVNPDFRKQGIGEFLIRTMEQIACTKYDINEIHLACFNNNTKGILLYAKLGYRPYEIEERINKEGEKTALLKMRKIIKQP